MSKEKYTPQDLDARLKFIIGITLGAVLFITVGAILYGLIFVTQPIGAQAENDKMFFNVLSSIATFITGALAGLMVGAKGQEAATEAVIEEEQVF
jgi:energy-coupling factor transporter transmembrane protein EcfT